MKVEIITPDTQLFNGDADSLVVPGSDGLIGILDNHAPLISSLKAGVIKVSNGAKYESFDVKGGVVEVLNNKVMILAQ